MSERCGELVATDEPALVTKPSFDAIVMWGGQGGGGLADSTGINQSDWLGLFYGTSNLLNQLVTPK